MIYHGIWGEAPFQGLYARESSAWAHLSETPGWYIANAVLLVALALGFLWPPLFYLLPLLFVSAFVSLLRGFAAAIQARFPRRQNSWHQSRLRALTGVFNVLQPVARFWGRIHNGLTPWKTRGRQGFVVPYRRQLAVWTDQWIDPHVRLANLEKQLLDEGLLVCRGNAYEPWDLQVSASVLGEVRVLMAVEDHGSGTQYVRSAVWPRYSKIGLVIAGILAILAAIAAVRGAYIPAVVLGLVALFVVGRATNEAGRATASTLAAGCPKQQRQQAAGSVTNV